MNKGARPIRGSRRRSTWPVAEPGGMTGSGLFWNEPVTRCGSSAGRVGTVVVGQVYPRPGNKAGGHLSIC